MLNQLVLEHRISSVIEFGCGDGNQLFNVGPMPTGEIEPRQVARLKEMGAWLSRYGESIYATRGGPFRPGAWGAATCKGNTVYVHILAWKGDTLALPPLPRKSDGCDARRRCRLASRQVVTVSPPARPYQVRPVTAV